NASNSSRCSASIPAAYGESASKHLTLCVLRVCGGNTGPRIELVALFGKQLFEGAKQQQDVARTGRVAHQTDTPHFAFEVAQSAADLDAEPFEQLPANCRVIDAGGNFDGVEHRELVAFGRRVGNAECGEARLERSVVLQVARVASSQA